MYTDGCQRLLGRYNYLFLPFRNGIRHTRVYKDLARLEPDCQSPPVDVLSVTDELTLETKNQILPLVCIGRGKGNSSSGFRTSECALWRPFPLAR